MSATGRGVDALVAYLTGGASNRDPDASLGGAISTAAGTRMLGMGRDYKSSANPAIPGLWVRHVFPANGEGDGTLELDGSSNLTWTPPGATVGSSITLTAGSSAILAGSDTNKALRVTRESGLAWSGIATVTLMWAMNGVLGQIDLTSAQRSAGRTTYRAIALKADGIYPVINVKVWFPSTSGQATWSAAYETPSSGSIQTIATESTAPSGLSWVSGTSEGTALYIPSISAGSWVGLWIRRAFPASGTVAARELVDLSLKYYGA